MLCCSLSAWWLLPEGCKMAFLIFCFVCGYLIADPSCSSASSHVGMEAATFYSPPSPSDFHLPCLEIEGIWIKGGGAGERPFAKWAFPWLWECAQVPGYANFQTSVFRQRGERGGGHHGQPPDAGGQLERWPSSTLFPHFLSPWNSTNIPLMFKIQ